MESEYSKQKYFQIYVEDGILHSAFSKNLDIDLSIAKNFVEQRMRINGTTVMPYLMDATNLKSIDKESRDFLAQRANNAYISAGAIVVNNEIQRLIGMIFVFYYSVSFPYKIFEDKEKALNWLSHFKNIN